VTFVQWRIYSECFQVVLCWQAFEKENCGVFEMPIQNLDECRAGRAAFRNSETLETLLKAQAGLIPVAALATAKLEKTEVALFLARELLFLRSVADGAKLSTLALLFDELHVALLDDANAKIETERSLKKVS
jgi:hypothetical protein